MEPDPRVARALASADDALARVDAVTEGLRDATRRAGRAAREAWVRATRAVGVLGVSGIGAGVYGAAVGGLGVEALLIGVPLAGAAAVGAALLPTRRRLPPLPKLAELPPARLVPVAREWFERRRATLPRAAAPVAARVLARLDAMAPLVAALPAGDPRVADLRRLLADHLPRLVEAYAAVPEAARAADGAVGASVVTGLGAAVGELDRLWADLSGAKVRDLAVEGRFLEERYGSARGGPGVA